MAAGQRGKALRQKPFWNNCRNNEYIVFHYTYKMSNPTNTFVIYDPRMDNHVFEYGDGQHVESPFRAKIPFQSIQTIYNDSPLVT